MSLPANSLEISLKLLENPKEGQSAAKNVEYKYDKDYLIYDDGRVYSKKTDRFLKGKIDNVGYRVYSLAIINPLTSKKGKMVYAHRLVAEHFLTNPDNRPFVHHKDGNKLNNNVNNLEWVTEKQNYQYFLQENKIEIKPPKYYKKDLEGEQWRIILENPLYSVSSFGRVRNNKTNRLLHEDNSQKYVRVSLNDKKHYYLHRLVYCTFYDDYDLNGYVIDHIDNNPKNNKLDNLQKITYSENNFKRFQR